MIGAADDVRSDVRWIRQALLPRHDPTAAVALAEAAARGEVALEPHAERLERHGVLGWVAARVRAAGGEVPEETARRVEAAAADGRRSQVTLARFLERAAARGVETCVLKGQALAADHYPEPGLRTQADVDVLVAPSDVAAAHEAARECGLFLADRQLPRWWYRLTHFHLKLHPATALMKELEIHWRLHSPALLYTVGTAELFARARRVEIDGQPARTLDELDRFLHLATHLASHWLVVPAAPEGGVVADLLDDPNPPVKLKWVLDLLLEADRLAAATAPEALIERTFAWRAEPDVSDVLEVLADEPALSPRARAWVRAVRTGLPAPRPRPPARRSTPDADHHSHGALDFRLEALRALPAWAWPPSDYLRRRYRGWPPVRRLWHLLFVLAHVGLAGLLLPAALAGRRALRAGRRRARARALEPNAVFDLVRGWRKNAP